jgi:hypothetical protein
MTKTRFKTFPTACVSGATRSKVLVATCNCKFKFEVRKQKRVLEQSTLSIKLRAGEQKRFQFQQMQKHFKFESYHVSIRHLDKYTVS